MSTVMSLANKHIITCIVRPVNPDSKRGFPVAEYMKRFHVSKWKCGQGARTKTLMVVHALVPEGNFLAYCKKLQRTFLSWLPPNNNTLCPKLSLQDILDCELDRGSVYFINTLEFTGPDPSDVDYAERSSTELTFGLQIQSYNETMPVRRPNSTGHDFQDPFTRETTHTPHMDDSTRRKLGLTPRRVPSATPTMPEQGPSAGSYPADEPSTLQVAIEASVNEPQPTPHSTSPVSSGRPTDLYTCPCCYELTQMCVFNCGHIACENCILKSVAVSGIQRCFYCNIQWTSYRFVCMSSVSQDVICADCTKTTVYIKPCSHVSCECPTPVCLECARGETVRLYL